MKVAVLGTGFGIVHIQTFMKHQDIEEIIVFSRSEEKLKNIQRQYAVMTTTDISTIMEDKEIKLVSIALPIHLHKEMAIMAMRHHKDVICEIPVGMNMEEISEIEAVERQTGQVVMTNLFMRYRPSIQILKQYCENKTLGKLLELRFKNNSGPVWGYHPLDINQLVVEACLSDFDALYWICDDIKLERISFNDESNERSSIQIMLHALDTTIQYACSSMMTASYGVQEEYEAIFEQGVLHYQEISWTSDMNMSKLIEYTQAGVKSLVLKEDNHYDDCLNDCIQQIKEKNKKGLTNLSEAKKSLYMVEQTIRKIKEVKE